MRKRLQLSPDAASSPLLWFAVVGPALAWALQFGIGYWITQAQCGTVGPAWGIPVETWAIVVGAVAWATAFAAGLTAVTLFRRTREAEHEGPPPEGRIHFLAVVGMTITPLFLCLIAMTAAGTVVLFPCNQS